MPHTRYCACANQMLAGHVTGRVVVINGDVTLAPGARIGGELVVTGGEVRVTGGGAKSDLWMQMLADVLRAECARIEGDEGPAFGAAVLAGVGIGAWPDVGTACGSVVRTGRRFKPSGADYCAAHSRYKELYGALNRWP